MARRSMIPVTKTISLDEREIEEHFIRAGGPGGQNVNKVSSAVQLRFDVRRSRSLPAQVRRRLEGLAGHRLTREGVLIINARRYRTQERNRADALERLVDLIRHAAAPVAVRRPTRPPPVSRLMRLEDKTRRARAKRLRVKPSLED